MGKKKRSHKDDKKLFKKFKKFMDATSHSSSSEIEPPLRGGVRFDDS